jgi:hypothetical protein
MIAALRKLWRLCRALAPRRAVPRAWSGFGPPTMHDLLRGVVD